MNNTFEHTITNDSAAFNHDGVPHIYDKCIGCPDVGTVCNGPNMLTLPIEGVREMVKRRKNTLKLSNEELSRISGVPIATVNRFLSPSVTSGFSYATVSAIVRAVIGGGQQSYSFNENPCPATSSEIRQKTAETERQLAEVQAECQHLREELDACQLKRLEDKQKKEIRETAIKEEDQRKIDHLLDQVDYLEDRCEYLKDTAEKRYGLIVDRDNTILTLQKTASRWRAAFIGLMVICAVIAVLLAMYIVWDFTHDGRGIFW